MNWDMNQRRSIHMFGNPVMQTWFDLFFLNEILTYEHFDTIIEIGAFRGGLAIFFGLHAANKNAQVLTFDLRPEPEGDNWKLYEGLLPIYYYQLDVFKDEATNLISGALDVGRTLLFCDGGNKPLEFKTFAPMLKKGDVIMAHDKGREIYKPQIEGIAEECALKPYYQTDADWVGADIFSFICLGSK